MTWIKTSERLPEDGQVVLCATRNMFGGKRYVFPCIACSDGGRVDMTMYPAKKTDAVIIFYRYGYDERGHQHRALHVTHWQPLPPLSEEQG